MDFGRTFVALDPDGHRLRVFAPKEGQASPTHGHDPSIPRPEPQVIQRHQQRERQQRGDQAQGQAAALGTWPMPIATTMGEAW